MKKTFASVLLFALSFAAVADVKVKATALTTELGQSQAIATGAKSSGISVGGFVFLDNGVTLEARNVTVQTDATPTKAYGAPTSWQEFGVGYSVPVGFTNVYGKAFFIPTQKNGMRYNAHAEEIGVAGLVGATGLKYSIGYRVLDSFKNDSAYKAENAQVRTTVSYGFTKNHSVYVRHTKQRGDFDQKMLNAGYSYSF